MKGILRILGFFYRVGEEVCIERLVILGRVRGFIRIIGLLGLEDWKVSGL